MSGHLGTARAEKLMGIHSHLIELNSRNALLMSNLVKTFDLKQDHISILLFLGKQEEPVMMMDLTRMLAKSNTTTTFRVEELEAAGHVKRVPSLEDRRSVYAELTDRGKSLLSEIQSTSLRWLKESFNDFSDFELSALETLLRKLNSRN